MKQAKILSEIKIYLQAVGYQELTQTNIYRGIESFLNWLACPIKEVNMEVIKAYHQYLKERPNRIHGGGLSSRTISMQFWHIRVLFAYLERQGLVHKNPASVYKLEKGSINKRSILSQLEIKELYGVCKSPKDRLILDLFYGLALRRSEGQALNLGDIDLKNKLIYIKKAKQGGSRKLPLSSKIIVNIKAYLASRPASSSPALMLNNYQKRMLGDSYLKRLKTLLSKTTITKKIDLHCLRHSIASHLIINKMPIEQVRDYLGHRHIESTQNYIHYGHQDLSV
ncbi:MAG: tyrosine-type recombinase/integrase [Aureispira sp.]|nr:tyrosine-type recombinase/integrase [Aureispira sp.]